MSGHKKKNGFVLPPHANAKTHARIMAKLRTMSADEFFETLVRAQIYDEAGRLRAEYRSPKAAKRVVRARKAVR